MAACYNYNVNDVIAPHVYIYCVSKNVTTLIVNNFYKLEPILTIFGRLYAESNGF